MGKISRVIMPKKNIYNLYTKKSLEIEQLFDFAKEVW